MDLTNHIAVGMRLEGMRSNDDPEPIVCPACQACRLSGSICPRCGHRSSLRSRYVVQVNGTLREVEGKILRPHKAKVLPDTQAKWDKLYYRAKSKSWDGTFNQAEAMFFHENHYWPPRTLAKMPANPIDWFRKVGEVPRESLLEGLP